LRPPLDQRLSVVVRFFHRIGSPDIFKGSLLLMVAIFIFIAIVFSLSRMGLVTAVFSIFSVALLTRFAKSIGRVNWKLILGSVFLAALIVVWIGVRPIAEHFARLTADESVFVSESAEGRLDVWRDAAKLVRLHPLTGIGLGCFEFAFTRFQSSQLMLIVDHAHNDFLELTVELGVPASLLLLSLILSILFGGLRAAVRLSSRRDTALAIGCVSGIFALLLHSFVDFNLYIPANAVVLAVLLGICRSLSDQPLPVRIPS
jgi:O-antigen ligase